MERISMEHSMHDVNSRRDSLWRVILTALIVVTLFGLMVAIGAAADSSPLDRKIQVMEKVIDEVMVQSPNVVVSSFSPTRGLMLDEYGVLFTLDLSLMNDGVFRFPSAVVGENVDVLRWSRTRARDGKETDDSDLSLDELQARAEKTRRKHLEGLRGEIIDTLLDYGPTLGELPPDRWVTVVVFLGDRGPFKQEGSSRMTVKARMRDLKRFASGDLSRQDAAATFVVDER